MRRKREKRKQSGYRDKESSAQFMIDEPAFTITFPSPRSVTITTVSSPASDSSTTTDWDAFDWDYTWIKED